MPILCTLVLGVVWWVSVVGYGHVTSMAEKNRENPTAPATRAEATKRENSLRLAPSSPPPTTLPAPETASIPSQTSEFYSGFLWWELAVVGARCGAFIDPPLGLQFCICFDISFFRDPFHCIVQKY